MDSSVASTKSTSTSNGTHKQTKKFITIPIEGNLQQSLPLMSQEQITFNLLQLNLVSMYNEIIRQKMYDWSKQTKFYLRNRYLLQKLINCETKADAYKKSVKEIVQKYDTVYVNGTIRQNAKQKHILKHGFNKQARAQFISAREEFTTLLQELSIQLKLKSKTMSQQDLEAYFITELNKINKCEIHADISPNKLELVKQASCSSSQSSDVEVEEISQQSMGTPKKQNPKHLFSMCFHGDLSYVTQICIQKSKFLHTKNRCPLVLDFGFSRFIFKMDDQLSHQIISMHLMRYINKIICYGSDVTEQIIQYEIIPQSRGAFYEYIENALTVNEIKKKFKGGIPQYLDYLEKQAFETSEIKISSVRKRFAQSYAGFCIVQYLLDLKDRNNSNIMIRDDGSIFHIDLTFIFNASPGGISFESCPFKFTKEYLDAMGGFESDCFKYFQTLLMSNMTRLSINRQEFMTKINYLSSRKQEIACFKKFKLENYSTKIPKKHHKVKQLVEQLISNSYDNWRTKKYDDYQFNTNQILP